MRDRTLVLRFLAFYERTHHKCTNGLKRFFNDFLEAYQNPSDSKLRKYEKIFDKCMRASVTVFGDNGFRLKKHDHREATSIGEWATQVNTPIFQCIATSFSSYDLGKITRSSDAIYEEYLDLITTDDRWVDCVRRATGDLARLDYVFSTWKARLNKAICDVPKNDSQRLFSKKLKKELFEQDRTCAICEQEVKLLDDAVLDHEEHYWRGGKTIPENARLVHRFCNNSRGAN